MEVTSPRYFRKYLSTSLVFLCLFAKSVVAEPEWNSELEALLEEAPVKQFPRGIEFEVGLNSFFHAGGNAYGLDEGFVRTPLKV